VKRPRRRPLFDDKSRLLDRFGLLLVVTVASIVILALIDIGPRASDASSRWESTLASVLVGATLLLALRASGLSKRPQRIADLVVIIVVSAVSFLAVVTTFTDIVPPPGSAAPLLVVLLAIAAPMAIIRRLVQHREVTRGTLLGAISGYLLLPIAFFYVFIASTSIIRAPFFGESEPTTSYMYFSLTTITTTGYGDLTAASPLGRLLAMAEAVTGQVYLVTFVAMLVGLFAANRMAGRPAVADSPEPEAPTDDPG
jgi:Ion channel